MEEHDSPQHKTDSRYQNASQGTQSPPLNAGQPPKNSQKPRRLILETISSHKASDIAKPFQTRFALKNDSSYLIANELGGMLLIEAKKLIFEQKSNHKLRDLSDAVYVSEQDCYLLCREFKLIRKDVDAEEAYNYLDLGYTGLGGNLLQSVPETGSVFFRSSLGVLDALEFFGGFSAQIGRIFDFGNSFQILFFRVLPSSKTALGDAGEAFLLVSRGGKVKYYPKGVKMQKSGGGDLGCLEAEIEVSREGGYPQESLSGLCVSRDQKFALFELGLPASWEQSQATKNLIYELKASEIVLRACLDVHELSLELAYGLGCFGDFQRTEVFVGVGVDSGALRLLEYDVEAQSARVVCEDEVQISQKGVFSLQKNLDFFYFLGGGGDVFRLKLEAEE